MVAVSPITVSPSEWVSRSKDFFRRAAASSPMQASKNKSKETPPLLEDVNHLLDSCKEDSEARHLLHGMVADLLRENDMLRVRLAETEKERETLAAQQSDQLVALEKAVSAKTTDAGEESQITPERADAFTPEEAAEWTIQSLTRRIEQLSAANSELQVDRTAWRERAEDSESLAEARCHQVEALETQFKQINKTRQKVVQKLMDGSASHGNLTEKSDVRQSRQQVQSTQRY